ncbi:MAG: DUF2723 domain-containing protein, partial [Phycisphaerae bacterium]
MASTTRHDRATPILLGLSAFLVYAWTLDRGGGGGDVGEMQLAAYHLGIAHPPGYALQAAIGHLFCMLSIGSPATRVNLLSAVAAAACVGLLAAALRRLDLRSSAAAAGALMLAFSDLFWRQARYAEVYAFHTALLAGAVLAAVAFRQSRRASLLWVEALLLGALCSARPCALLLIPAFIGFHWCARGGARERNSEAASAGGRNPPTARRARSRLGLQIALCFALPYVYVFAYLMIRDQPGAAFNYINDHAVNLRHESAPVALLPDNATWAGRLHRSLWTMRAAQFQPVVSAAIDRVETGLTDFASRLTSSDLSMGGVILMFAGLWRWRRRTCLLVLALGLLAGNQVFYLSYNSWDRITFTLPSLLALAMLVAAGADALLAWSSRRAPAIGRVAVFLPAAFLAIHNFEQNDGSNPQRLLEATWAGFPDPVAQLEPILLRTAARQTLQTPLPDRARIYTYFSTGRALQCVLTFEKQRTDV